MQSLSNQGHRRYMKISQKSGCISTDYNLLENDGDSEIIPYDNNEISGLFKRLRNQS